MWDFRRFGDKTAVVDDSGLEFTFNELADEGDRLFNIIGKRTLVFCLCRNTAGMVMGYTSFLNHKVVPLMLNADIDKMLLDSLLETYKPEYLWFPDDILSKFNSFEPVYNAFGFVLARTGFDIKYELNDELCILIPTSGSTGSPKLVRMSYENIRSNAVSITEELIKPGDVTILNLPMNYTYILAVLNSHLMLGYKVLPVTRSFMQKEYWDFFRENGSTEMHGVPNTYEMLMRLKFDKMNLPKLRFMTQSGGKMSYELHKKMGEFALSRGIQLNVIFGQSEATAMMGYLPVEMVIEKCGSTGKAIPGSEFYLIDEDGNRITKSGVMGELVFKGPGVTLGYAECGEDLSRGDDFGGVLLTGDMATFDDDGYFYITGRKKRFLKLYGNRTSLDEVETLIKGAFPEIECAATGKDDEMHIYITDEQLICDVKGFISEKTGIFHGAFNVVSIDEIPKNEAGKILYKELL